MKYNFSLLILVTQLALLTAAGCATEESHQELEDSWCEDFCDWLQACDSGVADCSARCIIPAYGEPAFYAELGSCLATDQSCSGGKDVSWDECDDQVAEQVDPKQIHFDLCETLGPHFLNCGDRFSTEACARDFAFLNEVAVNQIATDCKNTDCDAFSDCVGLVLSEIRQQ